MITAAELHKKKFKGIDLGQPWKSFFGYPEPAFAVLLAGSPGKGKSTLALQYLDYLSKNHGKALYVPAEEGAGFTVQEKLNRLGLISDSMMISEWGGYKDLKAEIKKHGIKFICLDSITYVDKRLSEFDHFRKWCKDNGVGVIFVSHATKGGQYKGNTELEHMVDTSVWVYQTEDGVNMAETKKNRFGQLAEMPIDFGNGKQQRENPTIPIQKTEGTTDTPGRSASDNAWTGKSINVTFEVKPYHTDANKMAERFGLEGIEFGNWLNEEEKITYMANTAHQLDRLADVLNVEPQKIGLGILSFGFGSRGIPKSLASYQGGSYLINLNKDKGIESLAHEYGHFVDHNLAGRNKQLYTEKIRLNKPFAQATTKKERYMIELFDAINAQEKFHKASIKDNYLTKVVERFARTFETYINKKIGGKDHQYLTHGSKYYERYSHYPEVTGEVERLMDKLVQIHFDGRKNAKIKPKTATVEDVKTIIKQSDNVQEAFLKVKEMSTLPKSISDAITVKRSGQRVPDIKKFKKLYNSVMKEFKSGQQSLVLGNRKNPSAQTLVYLGTCDELQVKQSGQIGQFKPDESYLLLSDTEAKTLIILPKKYAKPAKVESAKAEEVFEMFNQYAADGKDFKVQIPGGKTRKIGTGHKIYYSSDKIIQPGDKKGKINRYVHDFEPGKRQTYLIGDEIIEIRNVTITARGIEN